MERKSSSLREKDTYCNRIREAVRLLPLHPGECGYVALPCGKSHLWRGCGEVEEKDCAELKQSAFVDSDGFRRCHGPKCGRMRLDRTSKRGQAAKGEMTPMIVGHCGDR